MRHLLTAIAALLALALMTLMIGPQFVDWTQHRARIAALARAHLGLDVRLNGDVQLSLLPTPEFQADAIEIGPAGAPFVSAARLAMSLSPMALLNGHWQFTGVRLDRPVIAIDRLRAQMEQARAGRIEGSGIDRLELVNATFLIADATASARDAATRLDGINVTLEAPNFVGPFRLEMSEPSQGRDFRAQIGRFEDGRARLKGILEDKSLATRAVIDGWLGLPGPAGRALFDGGLQFNGNPLLGSGKNAVQPGFEGSARVIVQAGEIVADPINLALGPGEKGLQLAGRGFIDLASPRKSARFTLNARHFDATALLGAMQNAQQGVDWPPVQAIIDDIRGLSLPLDVGLDLKIGTIQTGTALLSQLDAQLSTGSDGPVLEAFSLRFPGQSDFAFRRDANASARFIDGAMTLESGLPKTFLTWLRGADPPGEITANTRLSATIQSGGAALLAPDLTITGDSGIMRGSARLALPVAGQAPLPRLTIALAAGRFTAAALAAFDPLRPVKGLDLSSELAVQELLVEGQVAGGLSFALDRDGDVTTLRKLQLTGRKGEEFIISGTQSGDATALTAKLDAETLQDIANLAAALLPGAITEGLGRRAALLAPALAIGTIRIETKTGEAIWDIALDGKLGGSDIRARTHSTQKDKDLHLDLDAELANADGAVLLGQILGTAMPTAPRQPGKLLLRAQGNPRRAIGTQMKGALAGVEIELQGDLNVFRPTNPFTGRLRATSADASILHQAMGGGIPILPRGMAASVEGQVIGERAKITLTGFEARFGPDRLRGEISFDLARGGQVAGQIKLREIELETLLAPALGRASAPLDVANASKAPFPPPLMPLLPGDLWIETEKMRLPNGVLLDDAQFVLRFAPGMIGFEGFESRLDGARIAGGLLLSRKTAQVDASGRVALERLALLPAGPRISGELPFSTQGGSLLELLSSLNGAGQVHFDPLNLPASDPLALKRLLALPLDALVPVEENRIGALLEAELKKSSWRLPALAMPVTVNNGQIRLSAPSFSPGEARRDAVIQPSLLFDLPRATLEAKLELRSETLPPGWRGAQPEIALVWRGKPQALQRQLVVSSLVNGLLAMSLQRDLERIEAFEADTRERAAMNRRAKAEEFRRRRASDIEIFERREAEIKDAERKRVEAREIEAREVEAREAERKLRDALDVVIKRASEPAPTSRPLDIRPPPNAPPAPSPAPAP